MSFYPIKKNLFISKVANTGLFYQPKNINSNSLQLIVFTYNIMPLFLIQSI
jgi:hypothetical protein